MYNSTGNWKGITYAEILSNLRISQKNAKIDREWARSKIDEETQAITNTI